MCKSHKLGSAKTDTGYYNYWKDLRPLVNKQATNAFWNNSNLKFYEKHNVMRYRTGTNLNQNTPTGTASLPMQTAPCALALLVKLYSQIQHLPLVFCAKLFHRGAGGFCVCPWIHHPPEKDRKFIGKMCICPPNNK